jgi:hypothetical protein
VLITDIRHQFKQNTGLIAALLPRQLYLSVYILYQNELISQGVKDGHKILGPECLLLHFLLYFFVIDLSYFFEVINFIFQTLNVTTCETYVFRFCLSEIMNGFFYVVKLQ